MAHVLLISPVSGLLLFDFCLLSSGSPGLCVDEAGEQMQRASLLFAVFRGAESLAIDWIHTVRRAAHNPSAV